MQVEYSEQMDIWTAFWGGYAGTGDTEQEARDRVTEIVMREGPPEGWTRCCNGGEEEPDNRHWIHMTEGRLDQVSVLDSGIFWYVSHSGWCSRCKEYSGSSVTGEGRAVHVAGACEAAMGAVVDPQWPQACKQGECPDARALLEASIGARRQQESQDQALTEKRERALLAQLKAKYEGGQ